MPSDEKQAAVEASFRLCAHWSGGRRAPDRHGRL